ncbi:hypothetical protein [Paenibacillus sp. GM2FR]|uniref:hypothetical protein n=1 Tax=Paenibacillus sp. GM2FR TaxID=2059268 RepID=UPI001055ADB6|nr:hypothetical protein [Paenibacillus sp. GM2FR]
MMLQRKKFGSKGEHYRFSGIDSPAPLVRVGSIHPKSLPPWVGEGRDVKVRCAVVSFLQSLLTPNFLDWMLQREKFGSKGDHYRFSGIDSPAPLVR